MLPLPGQRELISASSAKLRLGLDPIELVGGRPHPAHVEDRRGLVSHLEAQADRFNILALKKEEFIVQAL